MKKKLLKLLIALFTTTSCVACGNKEPTHTDYSISFTNQKVDVDEEGYGELTVDGYDFVFSKVLESSQGVVDFQERGVFLNKSPIGAIKSIEVSFANVDLGSPRLYYGDHFLSFTNVTKLSSKSVINIDTYCSYFVIQCEAEATLLGITINYQEKKTEEEHELPVFDIRTKKRTDGTYTPITSRTRYVDCTISFTDPYDESNNITDAVASIKKRGNSSANGPKGNYRLKFDEKQTFFGLKKNKSWVIIGEWLDGSKVHNYSALSFVDMVRGGSSFSVSPHHVKLILNEEEVGIYLFMEHVNENKGRVDVKQDYIWEKSFNEINFLVERNLHTDPDEEGGLVKVEMSSSFPVPSYIFSIKYPEAEDFEEEKEDGSVISHKDKYDEFYAAFAEYITNICRAVDNYYQNNNANFSALEKLIDIHSLALFGVTDQVFSETDHQQKSFKIYRKDGGKLMFGPNWDYDSCVDGLHAGSQYEDNPYINQIYSKQTWESTWFGETWGYTLFKDKTNGVKYFKEIWKNITDEMLEAYFLDQYQEVKNISRYYIEDTEKWMKNQFYSVFDNLTYHFKWIESNIPYLKNYYKNVK